LLEQLNDTQEGMQMFSTNQHSSVVHIQCKTCRSPSMAQRGQKFCWAEVRHMNWTTQILQISCIY